MLIQDLKGDFPCDLKQQINLIDVGANQIASIAASVFHFWSMMMQTEH